MSEGLDTEYTVPLSDEEKSLGVEVRNFEFGNDSVPYKILNILTPEQWQPAKEFSLSYLMKSPGMANAIEWMFTGISHHDHGEITRDIEEPVLEERPELTAKEQLALSRAFNAEKEQWKLKRQVRMLEIATGSQIPGSTMAEKTEWLAQRDDGELESVYHYITDICTGLREGTAHELMKQIHAMTTTEVKHIKSLSDWGAAAGTAAHFRMCRAFQDYVVQIPLKGISTKRKGEIDAECIYPAPPLKAGIDPQTGKPSGRFAKPNPRDPDYLMTKRAIDEKWLVLMLDECLPFQIPGENLEQKRNWISARLLGDVAKITNFIRTDLCGTMSRYEVFTKGSVR